MILRSRFPQKITIAPKILGFHGPPILKPSVKCTKHSFNPPCWKERVLMYHSSSAASRSVTFQVCRGKPHFSLCFSFTLTPLPHSYFWRMWGFPHNKQFSLTPAVYPVIELNSHTAWSSTRLVSPPSEDNGQSRLSPVLLTNGLHTEGSHDLLLEWFTELRKRVYLLLTNKVCGKGHRVSSAGAPLSSKSHAFEIFMATSSCSLDSIINSGPSPLSGECRLGRKISSFW